MAKNSKGAARRSGKTGKGQAVQHRDDFGNPSVSVFDVISSMDSSDGLPNYRVTPERAMRVMAFFACVRILSNTIASLDMNGFAREQGTRVSIDGDPRMDLVNFEPNPDMTPFDLWLYVMVCLCTFGSALIWMETDDTGAVIALWPISPRIATPAKAPDGSRGWLVQPVGAPATFIFQDEAIPLSGVGLEVGRGMAPYKLARSALGIAVAAEEYAGRVFTNDARPGGVLSSEKTINDEQWEIFQNRWKSGHEGLKNSHKIGLLPPGVSYTQVDWNPAPYQHIEAREYEVAEMARLFGIPLHYLGVSNGATTYASVESQAIDFVTYTLLPYLVNIQQRVRKGLFNTPADRARRVFVEYDVSPLMRADSVSRAKVEAVHRMWAIKTVNELRETEGLPPVDGGDILWMPQTMAPLGPDGHFLEAAPAMPVPVPGTVPIDGDSATVTATGEPAEPSAEPNRKLTDDVDVSVKRTPRTRAKKQK